MGLKSLFHRKKKYGNENSSHNGVVLSRTNSGNNSVNNSVNNSDKSGNNSVNSRAQIVEELTHVFKKFDVNGDGKISSSELGSIIGSLGHRPNDEELERMIKEVDGDGDGFIDLEEFIELNTKDVDSTEVLENLRDAFSVFDMDNNGLISAEELQKVLGRLEEECTIGDCRKMIAGVDVNGDGMISFDEFRVMMMSGVGFDGIGLKVKSNANDDN